MTAIEHIVSSRFWWMESPFVLEHSGHALKIYPRWYAAEYGWPRIRAQMHEVNER